MFILMIITNYIIIKKTKLSKNSFVFKKIVLNNNKDYNSNFYNKFYNIKNNEENKIQNFLKKN